MSGVEIAESWWWWAHVAASWALVGLIWTVQIVVYPQMARQAANTWVFWHAGYTRRMGFVVGPLMLIELGGAAWWCFQAPTSQWAWLVAVPVALNWLSTAFVQMPIHRALAHGLDHGLIRRLVTTNWIRTASWSLRGILLLIVAAG